MELQKKISQYDFLVDVVKMFDLDDVEEISSLIKISKFEKGKITTYDKNVIGKDGNIWCVLSGAVQVTWYPSDHNDYSLVYSPGQWIGVSPVIIDNYNSLTCRKLYFSSCIKSHFDRISHFSISS